MCVLRLYHGDYAKTRVSEGVTAHGAKNVGGIVVVKALNSGFFSLEERARYVG